MTTIKLGTVGTDVQKLSNLLGIKSRMTCDQEMVEAMKKYQKALGLVPDGVFGYKSWKNLMITKRYSSNPNGKIVLSDYDIFAWLLGCEPEMIRAFTKVESNGSGFLGSGKPVILFESYQFYKNLKSEGIDPTPYLKTKPNLVTTSWIKNYYGGEKEWGRLEEARKISESAANKSASWGLLQIMGSNYKLCDKSSISEFVKDMEKDEFTQLSLGIDFLKGIGASKYLVSKDFKNLAKTYNGPGYASNKYDIKLKNAYYGLRGAK